MTQQTMSGAQALAEATGDAGYDTLAEGIKSDLSHREWLWLSDAEKARFIQNHCEPEAFDDGV